MLAREERGAWSARDGTAAGCLNFGRFHQNPRWKLHVPPGGASVLVRVRPLRIRPPPSVNVAIIRVGAGGGDGGAAAEVISARDFAAKAALAATSNNGVYTNPPSGVATPLTRLDEGEYVVVPSTFKPLEGEFALLVFTDRSVVLMRDARPVVE